MGSFTLVPKLFVMFLVLTIKFFVFLSSTVGGNCSCLGREGLY